MSDDAIENRIQELGLNAPRVTLEHVNAIADASTPDYHVFPETCLTVCALTLPNGYTVTGESACASPENFNQEVGEDIAYENAKKQIWGLEGYLLKQALYEGTVEKIAKACHELNRSYCAAIGDWDQPPWEEASEHIKLSVTDGVMALIEDPDRTPQQMHRNWMTFKMSHGWTWGPEKDEEKKTHPNICSWESLDPAQRAKDHLFHQTVRNMTGGV